MYRLTPRPVGPRASSIRHRISPMGGLTGRPTSKSPMRPCIALSDTGRARPPSRSQTVFALQLPVPDEDDPRSRATVGFANHLGPKPQDEAHSSLEILWRPGRVLVFLASFHHQIASLKVHEKEVAELREPGGARRGHAGVRSTKRARRPDRLESPSAPSSYQDHRQLEDAAGDRGGLRRDSAELTDELRQALEATPARPPS